jgi:putative endonuclease
MLLRSTIRALDRLTARLGRAPDRAPHLVSGARGEDEPYFYLRKLGFTIVARDYRSPRRRGDLDLIAWEKETLCFIEVKTRSRRNFMPAEAAVDADKRATHPLWHGSTCGNMPTRRPKRRCSASM